MAAEAAAEVVMEAAEEAAANVTVRRLLVEVVPGEILRLFQLSLPIQIPSP